MHYQNMSGVQHASGYVTEHSCILLLVITQNAVTVLVSVLKLGVKDTAVQQRYSACKLFQATLVHTPQYHKSQADFSIFGCPGNTRLLSYLEQGGESPHHIQYILLSASESLFKFYIFLQGERCCAQALKSSLKPQRNRNEFCHYLQNAINSLQYSFLGPYVST